MHPSTITYTPAAATASIAKQRRYGGEFTIGGAWISRIVDRLEIYGEAAYTYGFTGLGQGRRPGGTCTTSTSGAIRSRTRHSA